ncbi:hypothetical protein GOBAR_DD30875 [Gossypium barbadense]|nr:hypothetical protein GOBAR_DD30875 [Gossypium barbadense]
MVQVDEAWFYDKYTQMLLIVVAQDINGISDCFGHRGALDTLMPRMGLRQAKQIETGHARCECEIFQTLRYPCAHVHAACSRANLNVEQFIDEIYTLQCTLRIWGNKFHVIPDVSNWEVPPPAFEMVPDRSFRRHPKGRPQSTRIQNDMDIRETGEPKLCTVC